MTSAHDDPIDTLTADAIRLARLGQTSEARERVDRAHRSVGATASPARRAALTLALAYILFFETRLEEAVDTIGQARDLAAAARSTDLEAECDATLALFHTRSGKMEETVRLARRALARASATADAVRYRAHLALATVMQVAGLPEAFAEYRAARECARRIKDDFAVAAAFHRMAVAQAIEARQQFEAGRMETETARQAIVGLQSSMEMTASLAPSVTKVVDGLMLAQLYLLTGELHRAQALYAELLPRARAEGHGPVMAHAYAEYASCQAKAGQPDLARELLREALDYDRHGQDPLSRGVLYRAAATTYQALGSAAESARFDALARKAWDEYAAKQAQWRELIKMDDEV